MKKNILGVMIAVMAIVIFAGCEQVQKQTVEEPKYGLDDSLVDTSNEYVVDLSDDVKPHMLMDSIEKGDLSVAEKEGLILMREEEKLARDVYLVLHEKWGQNTFQNIAKSEQTHTDTVKFLLDKYGVADPVKDDTMGVFTAPKMQKLYDDLVAKGNKSITEALTVGAIVEDLDRV